MKAQRAAVAAAVAALSLAPIDAPAHAGPQDPPLEIRRATGEITVDGELGDPGWSGAEPIETWFEIRPGDNVEPKVANIAWLAYDEEFLYAAFDFRDPEPRKIRAPLANRDNVPSYTDYGGLIIDCNDDGQTAQMFLANPRGIQYDALSSDASGEDSAPDFFWESAGRVTAEGWTLEVRIPFSSLRYTESDPEQWRIMLYRNHPREFRYQLFTSRIPRESPCFICNSTPLVGLAGLPSGSHWVAAPYLSASQSAEPEDEVGTPLETGDPSSEVGIDAKWLPNPRTVLDLTLNPDFSQIESDIPLIADNERFALFFEERRPFFLEGADLFETPLRAVYTRTITSPRWGGRATGEAKGTTYTLLVADDRGGGSVVIPGRQSSELADQDFESVAAVGRLRRDFGRSFLSVIYSGREIDGGGHNRVFGPDFQWRPSDQDRITGQILWSRSETPDRTDLADEWDGRELSGHAAELWWAHATETVDWFVLYKDVAGGFRADNGFVPQVGYREGFGEVGYTFRPEGKGSGRPVIHRLRIFSFYEHQVDREGELITRELSPGFGMSGKWDSFLRFRYAFDEVRSGDEILPRDRAIVTFQVRPSRAISDISLEAVLGDEVDFVNDRPATGATLGLAATLRPSDRLELRLNADRRWLDVDVGDRRGARLFTASIGRLRVTYNLSSRSYVRLIGQYVATERDPSVYLDDDIDAMSSIFAGSVLFAYKLNWQTVLFLGYGDRREHSVELDRLEPAERQLFLKVSYAFQRSTGASRQRGAVVPSGGRGQIHLLGSAGRKRIENLRGDQTCPASPTE